ncbi:MAG: hypothetical protein NTZ63_06910 [Candidatus Omnitrophica bacterium]|nr:hypothetical protein [Candidatus Omnitrophota bacterium]
MRRQAQSFVEYALLVAVSLVAILIVANSFLNGSVKNSFVSHFNETKLHITGN